jgi:glycosyltransferase involved in cell wall biosynthesis
MTYGAAVPPAVSVVIPARNAAATLGPTLDALTGLGAEVVVVDDGSHDETVSLAERHPAVTQVVRVARLGPGAARNAGVAVTSGEVLAFLDADCVPAPGWMEAGAHALKEGADLVQGRVDPDPGAARGPFSRTLSVSAAWGLFESANLFVRRSWFDRAGGFPEGIAAPGKHLAEDVFFGWRVRRAGGRTAFCDEALVHHAVFDRSAREYIAERTRLRHFPAIAREVPELRRTFFRHRVFLTRQTAAFDAAVAGVAAAAISRSPLPLAAALPYARRVYRSTRHWPAHPVWQTAGATVAADAVGAAALVRGSIAARTLVL